MTEYAGADFVNSNCNSLKILLYIKCIANNFLKKGLVVRYETVNKLKLIELINEFMNWIFLGLCNELYLYIVLNILVNTSILFLCKRLTHFGMSS